MTDGKRGNVDHKRLTAGPWTAAEIARQKDANRAQVLRDRARGVSANLSEAAALARFTNRFADAFGHVRHSA